MEDGRFRAILSPVNGGSFTRLRLTGVVPSSVMKKDVARLVRALDFWSGWPVACVLCVDKETACWCEWWTDILVDIPERHLKVRYRRTRCGDAR
jgi:hypothetical protein